MPFFYIYIRKGELQRLETIKKTVIMGKLYPLKFKHIYKEKIWGGTKIKTLLKRNDVPFEKCGESWEISGVEGSVSVVSNGHLAGNSLQEIVEIYMDDIVGGKVYEKYGVEFPLLIKFLDTIDNLSVQVHPDDELSMQRHNAYGKTEMWYVMGVGEDACVYVGFTDELDRNSYMEAVLNKKLVDKLNVEKVNEGDVFYMPAGRIHALGKNILVAEIQQTSDVTYRIYDWDRLDDDGAERELHIDLSLDAIRFDVPKSYKTDYRKELNTPVRIGESDYFVTNLIELDSKYTPDYNHIDSFVIYMVLQGSLELKQADGTIEYMKQGETVLIPASIKSMEILPLEKSLFLEIHMPYTQI